MVSLPILLLIFVHIVNAFPESGHFKISNKNTVLTFRKSMYKDTLITLRVFCQSKNDQSITIYTNATLVKCVNQTNSAHKPMVSNHEIRCNRTSLFVNNIIISNGTPISDLFQKSNKNYLKTVASGVYDWVIRFSNTEEVYERLFLTVDMRHHSAGCLSPRDTPLLYFYAVMCAVYAVLALVWVVLSCRNWNDLLRIQYWIGAVILLGLLEKAMFVAEYQLIYNCTSSPLSPLLLAEIVSCVKRALARILLMIVCVGYGIVKQRLGPAMRKIIGVGVAYLIAALVEAYIRVIHPELLEKKYTIIADAVLVAIDALIVWWSFSYLIETIKQMRLKRNLVKFNLYRHFSNILIIVVISSVVFMVWALYTFRSSTCMKHWKEIWINDAFWHVLFSIVLLTIVILWRPSKNSQRYAYSPLLDIGDENDDDDDDCDVIMDNMTSGELRKPLKENQSKKADRKTAEDDLKWIEENIPVSAAEKMYPIVESDGEVTPSKVNTGKMD